MESKRLSVCCEVSRRKIQAVHIDPLQPIAFIGKPPHPSWSKQIQTDWYLNNSKSNSFNGLVSHKSCSNKKKLLYFSIFNLMIYIARISWSHSNMKTILSSLNSVEIIHFMWLMILIVHCFSVTNLYVYNSLGK